MRVLAIIGSPRKGNTYRFVQRIEEALKTHGQAQFDYLLLKDAKLGFCRGCFACLAYGEERCPLKDDRAQIVKDMLASNGVIFASPVYAMNMTALMKNLLDRTAYTLHRPRFFEQRALIACTTGALGLKETISRLAVVKYAGFSMVKGVGVVSANPPLSPRAERRIAGAAAAAAQRFHRALTRPRPSADLGTLVAFRAQQAAFGLLKDTAPGDYQYFRERGWLNPKCRYYVDVPISFFKAQIASVVGRLVRRSIRKEMR
jgi:multimeric flavodoxin WrbA